MWSDVTAADWRLQVASLARYRTALGLLFEGVDQDVRLVAPVAIDATRRTITADLRVGPGVLKLPWRPRIAAFETEITWTVGDDGIVHEQSQRWSISAAEALLETFTPGWASR
mmetsp:Transcript_3496/g.8987  ORF Transcript_3496/g.8987 Transcript_3496/m.8987 type:complete len:113 (-) Transcript_3496:159-497(-)